MVAKRGGYARQRKCRALGINRPLNRIRPAAGANVRRRDLRRLPQVGAALREARPYNPLNRITIPATSRP